MYRYILPKIHLVPGFDLTGRDSLTTHFFAFVDLTFKFDFHPINLVYVQLAIKFICSAGVGFAYFFF